MPLYLHNTLTGRKEEFKPLTAGQVSMYNCGPTVYNYAHIGNLRAYVFADTLRRVFEYNGYQVKQVMNITDVGHLTSDADDGDDKMVKALKREGLPMTLEGLKQVADKYEVAFVEDLKALNCELPQQMPRASEHIAEDIELIKKLEEKGIAYKTSDGMYFDTSKFPTYGKLGNINLEGLKEGARVGVNSEKRNPIDFSLWKFDPSLGWDSPWGKGFPGWHIECSAMSRKYLGQPFDVHTGGIDHIPVHHNNEIAQSEAAYDVSLANYWMHNAHLKITGGKMAKSGDNFITLATLKEKGIHPLAFRYYLLGARYSSPMEFSFDALVAAQKGYEALVEAYSLLRESEGSLGTDKYDEQFKNAINDDLNTAKVLALVSEILGDSSLSQAQKRALLVKYDQVLGLNLEGEARKFTLKQTSFEVPAEVVSMMKERDAARAAKDWKKSDELRDLIRSKGFEVKDTETGTSVQPL